MPLTLQNLQNQWPGADQRYPDLLEGIAASAPVVFPKYGLTSDLLVAHIMAQFSVETGNGTALTENLRYSAQGLLKTFPAHFNAATAAQYAFNEQMIGCIAYGGRLGNAAYPPSEDGYIYRGAGLVQATGRGNVSSLNAFLARHNAGFDIVAAPALLFDPAHALECGGAMFVMLGALPFAAADQVDKVSLRINGGTNGQLQREQALMVWKKELGVDIPAQT